MKSYPLQDKFQYTFVSTITICDRQQFKNFQRRMTGFVTNNYDTAANVPKMFHERDWKKLDKRKQDQRRLLTCKFANGLNPMPNEILIPRNLRTYSLINILISTFEQTRQPTKKIFYPRTIRVRN